MRAHQIAESGNESKSYEKRVKTLLYQSVHDHRFLVLRALYFRDIDAPQGEIHQLRCRIVIQLQYVPTGE